MKYLLSLLLLLAFNANATVTGSCTVNGSSSPISIISPASVFFDYAGTTDTAFTQGTGAAYVASAASNSAGTTSIALITGSGTICGSSVGTCSGSTGDRIKFSGTPITANIINGNPSITVTSTTNYAIKMKITGVGLPDSTSISAITDGTHFTLSQNPTQTNATASLTISDPNTYLVTTGLAAAGTIVISPGLIYPTVGAETVTILSNAGIFHNLQYETNFGDPNGSPISGKYWTNGTGYNTSRNYAAGPEAAHVYEVTPGSSDHTYTANVSIKDANGTAGVSIACPTVTAYDPWGINGYSAANTNCVGSGGASNSTCPNGGTYHQQTNLATAISSYTGANKLLYFQRGDTFTTTTTPIINASGGTLTAYGIGKNPILSTSTSGQKMLLQFNAGGNNWRVTDLMLDGTSATDATGITSNVANISNITVLRLAFQNLVIDAVSPLGHFNNATFNSFWTVQDSSTANANIGYFFYAPDTNYWSVQGNYIDGLPHMGVRMQSGAGGIYSNNTARVQSNAISIRGDSSNILVSDNKMTGMSTTPYIVSCNPQNPQSDETQYNIIFERNWFIAVPETQNAITEQCAGLTIRNNVFDLSAATNAYAAVNLMYLNTSGSPMPTLSNIYNNTVYSSINNNGNFNLVIYDVTLTAACSSNISNNLGYAPLVASPTLLTNAGSCAVTGAAGTNGNSSVAEMKSATSPFNATPVNLSDFRNIKSGTANNSTDSAVTLFPTIFDDFLHCKDKTASNFRSGAMVPAANAVCRGVP